MTAIPLAICAAYLSDLILGDPQFSWHPVRIMGKMIEKLEKVLNTGKVNEVPRAKALGLLERNTERQFFILAPKGKVFWPRMYKKFSGVLLVILVAGITALCVLGLLKLSRLISPVFHFIIYTVLIYFAIAVKSLAKEANKVHAALGEGDILKARKNLSMIVARDTRQLDEPEVIRATVETVAESTMDGIISPLFYAFLGGPVLAWGFKAVNTLDSMVGYKNERYADFGWAAAKIDAILNLIPSKIACFAILAAGFCCQKFKGSPLRCMAKYFFKGHGCNSESTEAVMASLLGIQLGGVNYYNSVAVEKKIIGENLYPLKINRIKESIKIAYVASGLSVAAGMFLVR